MRFSPLEEVKLIQAFERLLPPDEQEAGEKDRIKLVLELYYAQSKTCQDNFWQQVSQHTQIPSELCQRYFFFKYTAGGFTGNPKDLVDDIDHLILDLLSQDKQAHELDSKLIIERVWSLVKQKCKRADIHPGSVHKMIFEHAQRLRQKPSTGHEYQTPQQSIKIKEVFLYEVTPRLPVLSESFSHHEDDQLEMVQALAEIFSQQKSKDAAPQ